MQHRTDLFACVVCGRQYHPAKTRADYKGLCSMACQHTLARECGWTPASGRTEYAALSDELRRRRLRIPGAEPIEIPYRSRQGRESEDM